MGTGLLRRHRDALAKLRDEEAEREIAEVTTSYQAPEIAPVAEPEPVVEPAHDAPSTPNKSRRAKAQNAE